MKLMHLLLALVAAAVGLGAITAAQADDAPGLGLIGFLFIFGGVALGARTVRRSRQP